MNSSIHIVLLYLALFNLTCVKISMNSYVQILFYTKLLIYQIKETATRRIYNFIYNLYCAGKYF